MAPHPAQTSSVVSQPSAPLEDDRLNQLNELQTQDEFSSPSVLVGLSGVVNDACELAIGVLDATDSASSSSCGDSFVWLQDVCMPLLLVVHKRDFYEVLSSDDSSRKSRSHSRKTSGVPGFHLSSGVSAAAN